MTPEGWGTNLGAIVVGGVAAWQAWQARRTAAGAATTTQLAEVGDRATEAAHEAAEAVKNSPTANGFAADMREGIRDLVAGQRDMKGEIGELRGLLLGHINDHARSDVARH